VILKSAGVFLQNSRGNFDQRHRRILAVDPLMDGWRGRGPAVDLVYGSMVDRLHKGDGVHNLIRPRWIGRLQTHACGARR
jgi:hypothetical protein